MANIKNKPKKRSPITIRKIFVFLVTLFCASIFLRAYNISNTLFFGPEQGIDFKVIKGIVVDLNPALVGAKTDIAGVFHGPIYYYLSVIPFVLTKGDPIGHVLFFIIINSLTVFLIYYLGKQLFNKRAGIIASLIFTISFGAIVYPRWLSTHALTIPLSALFFIGLYLYLQGRRKWLLLAAVSFALLGQAAFLNYLFFGVMVLCVLLLYRKTFLKEKKSFLLLNVFVFFLFGLSHYLVFDIKNQFIMTKSLSGLIGGKGYYVSYPDVIMQTIRFSMSVITQNTFPFSPIPAVVTFLGGFVLLLKSSTKDARRLLLLWIFIPMVLMILLRHEVLEQFFVYFVVPSILLAAFTVDKLISTRRIIGVLLFVGMVFASLRAWVVNIPTDQYMFFQATQPDLQYGHVVKVVDRIYKRMDGKPFSFQSYTIPYWTQDAWEYVFWQYGKLKYGYEPVTQDGKTLFVIIQDDPSSLGFQKDWLLKTVSKWGTLKDTFREGIFTVQVLSVP